MAITSGTELLTKLHKLDYLLTAETWMQGTGFSADYNKACILGMAYMVDSDLTFAKLQNASVRDMFKYDYILNGIYNEDSELVKILALNLPDGYQAGHINYERLWRFNDRMPYTYIKALVRRSIENAETQIRIAKAGAGVKG